MITIEVWGKGSEAFLHKITEEQYETLLDSGLEDDQMDQDEISQVLNLDFFLDTDDIVTGIYHDSFILKAFDENKKLIWQSDDFEFSEYKEKYLYNDDYYLMISEYQKGNFFNLTLQIESTDFNPDLLIAETTELLDGVEDLITDLYYEGVLLAKELGDTRSNGFVYSLGRK